MSNNKWLSEIERLYDEETALEILPIDTLARLALVEELQTLNETLVRLTETDEHEDLHLSVKIRKGHEG